MAPEQCPVLLVGRIGAVGPREATSSAHWENQAHKKMPTFSAASPTSTLLLPTPFTEVFVNDEGSLLPLKGSAAGTTLGEGVLLGPPRQLSSLRMPSGKCSAEEGLKPTCGFPQMQNHGLDRVRCPPWEFSAPGPLQMFLFVLLTYTYI